jgi:hypothetical protein
VTLGNIPGTVGLAITAAIEFAFGVALTIHAAETGGSASLLAPQESCSPGGYSPYRNYACVAQKSPLASVNGNHLCAPHPQRALLIVSSSVSLFYGT